MVSRRPARSGELEQWPVFFSESRRSLSDRRVYDAGSWRLLFQGAEDDRLLLRTDPDCMGKAGTGGAILANYNFADASPLPGFNLPVRFEDIGSTGSLPNGTPNLLYDPGSNA